MTFATIEDLEKLWRTINVDELERAASLLEIVSNSLRVEADKVGKNLDAMILESPLLA